LRKDFKKYKIANEVGLEIKQVLKQALLKGIVPMYRKYLKSVTTS